MQGAQDPTRQKWFSLGELSRVLGATLRGDAEIRVRGLRPLEVAGPDEISFLTHAKYVSLLSRCKAGALIVSSSFQDLEYPLLISDNPYLTMARAAQLFAPVPEATPGVHPTAWVAPEAQVDPTASLGPLCQLGTGSRVGAGTILHGGVVVGNEVEIGNGCLLYPNVAVLDRCKIGHNVIIHAGTVIGSDGFGFAQDEQGRHVKIPQSGIVQIDDDVEIGSNCSIDRATFGRTWIQRGAKIDNLVMIAHNVVVGEDSILVAQVGISGSTRIGKHVVLAGQVGVAGHLEIGDGARVGAKSGVPHSIKPGEDMLGIPAVPSKQFFQTFANLQRLSQFKEQLRQLQNRVRQLEETMPGE